MPEITGIEFPPHEHREYPKWVDGVLVEAADAPEAAPPAEEPLSPAAEPEIPAAKAKSAKAAHPKTGA